MEFEEIIKKVQWIEDQERKGKSELKDLGDRVTGLNTSIGALVQQLKTLAQQVNDLSVAAARIDQFDQMLAKHRVDVSKSIETIDKTAIAARAGSHQSAPGRDGGTAQVHLRAEDAVAAEQAARKDRFARGPAAAPGSPGPEHGG